MTTPKNLICENWYHAAMDITVQKPVSAGELKNALSDVLHGYDPDDDSTELQCGHSYTMVIKFQADNCTDVHDIKERIKDALHELGGKATNIVITK